MQWWSDFFIPLHKLSFDSLSFLLSEKLLFAGIIFDHFASFVSVSFFPSILDFWFALRLTSACSAFQNFLCFWWSFGFDRSPSRFDFPLDDLSALILMVELLLGFVLLFWRIFLKPFKDLPVHWYHLFVSIWYHKKVKKSSLNVIQNR